MVDGRRVRSVVAGAGGPVVVLVPGLGAVGYLLDTLAGCAAWSRAHLLDVPGFGHAPPRPCPPEIPAMAATVSGWLDAALPGAEVVLAGHSTGAQVAVHVAVARPGRVRALALLGPTFPPAQRRLPAAALAAARTLPRERPGVVRGTVPYYVRAGARTMARFVRSAQRDEPEHLVARLTCPTLVARGEHDRFAPPEWTGHLAATAPKGWCLTVPGAHTFPYGQGGMTSGLIAEAANAAGAATAPWERPGHDHRRTGPAGDH
jgi:pimeloyl-ACP methyl ester carboxylesterase